MSALSKLPSLRCRMLAVMAVFAAAALFVLLSFAFAQSSWAAEGAAQDDAAAHSGPQEAQASDSTADIAAAAAANEESYGASSAASQSTGADLDSEANRVNPQQKPDSSFIYDTTISDLETADSYMDGQTVQITGEVVGDRITVDFNPDHYWLTIQATDGTHSEITTYVTESQSALVDTYGAYGKTGTVLQLRGTFNLTCAEHAGLTDLHVDHASVVLKGVHKPDALDLSMFFPGLALVVVGVVLTFVFYRMRESQR